MLLCVCVCACETRARARACECVSVINVADDSVLCALRGPRQICIAVFCRTFVRKGNGHGVTTGVGVSGGGGGGEALIREEYALFMYGGTKRNGEGNVILYGI